MIRLLGRIPRERFCVACSGGPDSMALVSFLKNSPKNMFQVIHYNHGTECCGEAEEFVRDWCSDNGIDCMVGHNTESKPKGMSWEMFWRKKRYEFFDSVKGMTIMTAHQLNDEIETWVMSSLRGFPKLIPYRNSRYNIIRPFLATGRAELISWNLKHGTEFVIDHSNFCDAMTRNFIRHKMMPSILRVSPGIEKIVMKKVLEEFRKEEED